LMRERGAQKATNLWGPQAKGLGPLGSKDPAGVPGSKPNFPTPYPFRGQ
jgi:hypothetical protein